MIPYILLFTIVIVICLFSEKYINNKNNKFSIFLLCLCVIILSIFSALRDFSVGTDVLNYGLQYFNGVKDVSFKTYLGLYNSEVLYLLLNYIVYHISDNFQFFLFIHQLILSSIVFKIAYDNRDRMSITYTIFIYLVIWFCSSFNIIRQSLATFILLYSFKYIENNKNLKYYLFNVVAIFFHSSAAIGLLLPLAYKISNFKNHKLWYFLISFLSVGALALYDEAIMLIYNLGFIKHRYLLYMSNGKINFNLIYSMLKILIIVITFIFTNHIKNNKSISFLKFMLVFEFIIFQLSLFTRYGYRFSYVYLPFLIYTIPMCSRLIKSRTNKIVYNILIITILVTFWVYRYVVLGMDGIYPFEFYH